MDAPARIALAVSGGYLLGRTKKMKLALTLGSMLAGKKMTSPGGLLGQGFEVLRGSPEFDKLRKQVTGAGRNAALAAATSSLGRVTQRVESGGKKSGGARDDDDDRDDDDRDDADDEYDDYEDAEDAEDGDEGDEGDYEDEDADDEAEDEAEDDLDDEADDYAGMRHTMGRP
jgi:hypothetical protein